MGVYSLQCSVGRAGAGSNEGEMWACRGGKGVGRLSSL